MYASEINSIHFQILFAFQITFSYGGGNEPLFQFVYYLCARQTQFNMKINYTPLSVHYTEFTPLPPIPTNIQYPALITKEEFPVELTKRALCLLRKVLNCIRSVAYDKMYWILWGEKLSKRLAGCIVPYA